MAEKLKIIPLGGLNEIGKNMTAYEYGGEIIVVDCGMAFPGDDMYGCLLYTSVYTLICFHRGSGGTSDDTCIQPVAIAGRNCVSGGRCTNRSLCSGEYAYYRSGPGLG